MAGLVETLAAKYFPGSRSELVIGDIPISRLALEYSTPLFVYDCSVMDRKLDALRATLPKCFTVYYSIKSNPNPAVLKHFLRRGCGLEIASAGELYRALQAGCPPERILFAGPGKTESELDLALAQGIGEIHIESLLEARRVGDICRRLGVKARVSIRVNPSGEAQGGAMRMGGRPSPFGVDEEVLEEVISAVLADPGIQLQGIHLFTGTQILDAAVLVGQYRHGLEVARRAVGSMGRPLQSVDFGGGLGIPYFPQERELDLDQVREGLAALWTEIAADPAFLNTEFIVEPGRFLIGEAGVYVARVNDIKVSRGKKFLILDGGMNHHLAASGNLGQTIKRNYPIAIVNRLDAPFEETVDVVGPLCTPLDTLARGVSLPKAEVGDLIGIFQSGAYGRTASPAGFLSHPAPGEILVDAGKHRRIEDTEAPGFPRAEMRAAFEQAAPKS